MILICGVATEPPVARAIAAAEAIGLDAAVFDQKQDAGAALRWDPAAGAGARLMWDDRELDLGSLSGVYVRLVDAATDPSGQNSPDPGRAAFYAHLFSWLNIAPIRIASRPRAMHSNASKTYQARRIRRQGFGIPETIVTNDPSAARDFIAACEQDGDEVIYKSMSGVRSIVQAFGETDRARLHQIRWCPTQFQRRVRGEDIRVHVVGDRTFATRIGSQAVDYRYARRQTGEDAELARADLPGGVAQACVRLAQDLELPFAGIDLRETPDGEIVCFEVNPCPAYSYYEAHTGAPIARALVAWLAGYALD